MSDAWMPRLPRSVLPVVAGLAVGLALVGTWALLRAGDAEQVRMLTEVTARQAAPRLRDFVSARLTVVESLAREQEQGMDAAAFRRRATILEASFGGLLAINWIDRDGTIRLVVPQAGNERALGRNVHDHPVAGPTFVEAERSGQLRVTQSLQLFQGPRGFASYAPVRAEGRTLGYVNGVFDASRMVETALSDGVLERYLVRVTDSAGALYASEGYDEAAGPTGVAQATVGGRRWTVSTRPRPSDEREARSHRLDLLLLLAVALGFVVAALVRGFLERRDAAAGLAEERAKLEREMQEAQRLESIGRLAGGVAHDFNNLLTAMIGHAQLARETPGVPQEAQEDIQVIEEAAQRGARITRDLLTFSRREVVQPVVVDVPTEVTRLIPMLKHLLREDIELEVRAAPDAGSVHMDPAQLERALMNLVVNAVDAQPRGGRVEIIVEGRAEGVCLRVRDEGEGMPPEVMARAFEPFFTTKEQGKGTGLGLASVYGMAQQLGGDVHLESQVGEGTTVSLLLPRAAGEKETASTGVEASERTDGRAVVLLVEDDTAVRHLAARALERAGYEVIQAANGQEALDHVDRGLEPEILFTDEVMPGLHGHELAAQLLDLRPTLKVLVSSGHAEDLIDSRKLEQLDAAFLQKPYTPSEMLAALRSLHDK